MSPEESNAIGFVIKEAGWWGRLLLGPSAKSLGENLGKATDHFFEQILKNRAAGAQLIDNKVVEGNVNARPFDQINLKVLGPLIEGISLESDDNLREMWANLFVNYIDSEKNLAITVYPNVLSQLSSNEAQILKTMDEDETNSIATGEFKTVDHHVEYEEIANLVRIGLIEPQRTITNSNDPKSGNHRPMERGIENDRYFLTQFGYHFLEACHRGEPRLR